MRHKIALIAGGYTGEFVISLGTAQTIQKNLDPTKYEVYKIILNQEAWWHETESGEKINVDKNDFSLTINNQKIKFDAVFIAIHGTPGEDGKLQGYLEMLNIPFTTCNSIVSALTFNKSFCNKILRNSPSVNIANSVVLYKDKPYSIGVILELVKLPLFVKPNESGSSLGVSKVTDVNQLLDAINKAFTEDEQVLIEEYIEGREFTQGVFSIKDSINTLPPTEILTQNAFFDYEAKYTSGKSNEITPAQIDTELLNKMQQTSQAIFQLLNCKGVVRIDYILEQKTNKLFFLEVNTMPGQSEQSIVPQQVRAAGMDLTTFYGDLLNEIL